MAEQVYLEKPPISEAILDIRVEFPEGGEPSKEELMEVFAQIEDAYPVIQELVESDDSDDSDDSDKQFEGYLCTSENESHIVALNKGGLGFSQVSAYSGGDAFKGQVEEVWHKYSGVISSGVITRVGLRFINKLEIEIKEGDDLEEFIACPPRAPKDTTDVMGRFFSSVTVADTKTDISAVITQAMKHDLSKEHEIYYLDIETYKYVEEGIQEESIWELYDGLRDLKNRIFFASVTDKALEKYK